MQAKQPGYDPGDVKVSEDWRSIAIQIAVATIFSGVIAYVATNPEQLVQAQAAVNHVYEPSTVMPAPVAAPAMPDEPIEVRNPFDKSEVFQFPAGTTESDARLAVAKLLMQRAHDREPVWARADHRLRKHHVQHSAGADLMGLGREVGTQPVSVTGVPES